MTSWPSRDMISLFYFIDYDLNIFWWRQPQGYSDVTQSLPTENKLRHHPILMWCTTLSALIHTTQKFIKSTKRRITRCLPHYRSLHFTLSLHFSPGPQSPVRSIPFTLTGVFSGMVFTFTKSFASLLCAPLAYVLPIPKETSPGRGCRRYLGNCRA